MELFLVKFHPIFLTISHHRSPRFKPKDEEAFAPNNPRGYVAKDCQRYVRINCQYWRWEKLPETAVSLGKDWFPIVVPSNQSINKVM